MSKDALVRGWKFTCGHGAFPAVPLENTLTQPWVGALYITTGQIQVFAGGIMESFKYVSAALVAVSAVAGFTVLLAAYPAMAMGTPTLTPSPMTVHAGDPITFDGSGFDACNNPKTSAASVLLLWTGQYPMYVTGSNGNFTLNTTVPDAVPGTYRVSAQCYDPSSGQATSHYLAVVDVQIVTLPPTLQLSSSQPAPGQVLTVTGDGFGQCVNGTGNWVDLLWDSARLGGQAFQADDTGHFSADVSVPADAPLGSVHTVQAECYDPVKGISSAILASSQLTVTAASPSPSPSSTLSPTSPSATASQGTGTTQGPSSPQGPASSLGPGSSQQPSPRWAPVALIGGTGGGLLVAAILAIGLHSMHAAKRRRGAAWAHEHLRVKAGAPGPPSATVQNRPGAMSMSLGLQPHADQLGSQELRG
jgi:hypothetical protein